MAASNTLVAASPLHHCLVSAPPALQLRSAPLQVSHPWNPAVLLSRQCVPALYLVQHLCPDQLHEGQQVTPLAACLPQHLHIHSNNMRALKSRLHKIAKQEHGSADLRQHRTQP